MIIYIGLVLFLLHMSNAQLSQRTKYFDKHLNKPKYMPLIEYIITSNKNKFTYDEFKLFSGNSINEDELDIILRKMYSCNLISHKTNSNNLYKRIPITGKFRNELMQLDNPSLNNILKEGMNIDSVYSN